MTSKGRKTPQDEPVLGERKRFIVGPTRRKNVVASQIQYRTGIRSTKKNLNGDEWMQRPTTKGHPMLTVLPDRHPPSHSHCTVRGWEHHARWLWLSALGFHEKNAIDITLISCLFFNWLSATEPWIAGKKKKKKGINEADVLCFSFEAAGI